MFAPFAAGDFDGNVAIGELLTHGDFGLGAADKLDGELIVVDGHAYQARAGGAARELSALETTPWAAVTFFAAPKRIPIDGPASQSDTERVVDQAVSPNLAVALKVTGTFRVLRVRAIPGPAKPYPPLSAAVPTQVTLDLPGAVATLVGFRLPTCVRGWNVPGYHFHALTGDRSQGGHVLLYEVEHGTIEVAALESFDLPKDAGNVRADALCP
jgi:acetolactate decarboxylase